MIDQAEIHRMVHCVSVEEREKAIDEINSNFLILPDKKQAWDDLIYLMHECEPIYHEYRDERIIDVDESLQCRIGEVLGVAYSQIPDKKQAWTDLIRLIQDFGSANGAYGACIALRTAISHVPDKKQAWSDLIQIALKDDMIIWHVIDVLNHGFYLVSDIHAQKSANYFLGRLCISKASEAENEEEFKNELEKAIKFFINVSNESNSTRYSAQFCLPFYLSFYAITFKNEEAEAEVRKYLVEAKSAVESSKSRKELLEAIDNLSNALKEVQNLREKDFNTVKCDLNAYRKYCERAADLLDSAEDKAPAAARLVRRGLPIIDKKIKWILAEIEGKTKALCKQVKDTEYSKIGQQANEIGQKLLKIRDPIGLEKGINNLLIPLSAICKKMPDEEKGEACEILKKINDEQYIEDKLPLISMFLTKISTQMNKEPTIGNLKIENSKGVQVIVGTGNNQVQDSNSSRK
jgi:hypothetical protein